MSRKTYLLTVLLLTMASSMMAVPVLRCRLTVTLDDGRRTTVITYGNEDFTYMLSLDGTVVTADQGIYHDTGLTLEAYKATLPGLPQSLQQRASSTRLALISPSGKKEIPVILLAFPDCPFGVANTEKNINRFYDNFFNADIAAGTTENYGSVRQYFLDQSQEQFEPHFTIIGPVTADSSYTWYGKQTSAYTIDAHYDDMVRNAFAKAQTQWEDWTIFDNDGNGSVDMCVILFAGMGQNYTTSLGISNTIWPKEIPSSYTVGGIRYDGCTSACEMRPTSSTPDYGPQPDGPGVVVHELSHSLGLPDFYDTRNVAFGMDCWSVMDYGQYIHSGREPVGYTAYEREFMGWQSTTTITGPCTLHLKPFAQGGQGYKLVNDSNPDECYILDNRQPYGWDSYLCSTRGHGLLVMHVDYAANRWNANTVNTDAQHQRMTIIPANNTLLGSNTSGITTSVWRNSLLGNPYPGITENHSLTNQTTPASLVYTGSTMGKPIMDIEETTDGTITAKVMPLGTLEASARLTLEDIKADSAVATWSAVENAERYNLRLLSAGEVVAQHDSIAATSFLLDHLKSDVDYILQVQAISDSWRNGPWVESEPFRADPDRITDIGQSLQMVTLYDLKGRFLGRYQRSKIRLSHHRHGIYLMRYADGTTKKILR